VAVITPALRPREEARREDGRRAVSPPV
jgi:hypothetical protein